MDQRNNTIQQFNIPPSTAYDPGSRYISSTVHNGIQGIRCPQSNTPMTSQQSFLQASLHNQSQQMLLIPNGARNSGNVMMNNQQSSIGYQQSMLRQPVVTLRTDTNYFGQQSPTSVHAHYITPSAQQPINTNYASNQNQQKTVNSMTGTVSSVNPQKRTETISTLSDNNILSRVAAQPQHQICNVNPNLKQVVVAPQLRLPMTTSDKAPENLIRLQKFLKQIVQDKNNIAHYLREGTVENLNLIAILCHTKFRNEFLRLSNNEKLKMQMRRRIMIESGKTTTAHSDSLNIVKSKSIQDILDTLLALTWIHPTNDSPNQPRQHKDSQSSMPALDLNNVINNIKSQSFTSQNQPSHSRQVSQPQPPVKVTQSNVISAVRVKKEPGLESANTTNNCSGSGGSFSTSDQVKSLAQPTATNNMYANFEDFVRMSDEAAEPIDSMFEPIVKENSKQRDVKPIVSNLLTSTSLAPKIPPSQTFSNALPSHANTSEPPDIKPVINPRTLSLQNHPPLTSVSPSRKVQSTMPNSNHLLQSLQSPVSSETDLKPKFVKPNVCSPLPENNSSKVTEKRMPTTTPSSSAPDNFLKTLEELQKNALDSLEASSSSSLFPQVTNQNTPNTSLVPFPPASQAMTSSSIPDSTLVTSSVTASPVITSATSLVTTSVTSLVTTSVTTPLRDKKKDLVRPLSPNNMCRVEADDQQHICSILVESSLTDKKMKDLIKVKKGEVICSLSSKMKPNPEANIPVHGERSHFWCNFCVYQTDNKLRLVNHVIAAHRFSCQFCKFQCYSRAEVFEHTVSNHQQANQMSKEFKLCVLLPDYLKMLEKIENLENDNFETEFIQSMKRKKVRAGLSNSSNSLESDWEEEFLEDDDDESESEMSDLESDDNTKKKGRKRKKSKGYLSSDDDSVSNDEEKKKRVSEAFKELQRRRKMKKGIQNPSKGSGDAGICSDPNHHESGKVSKKSRKRKVKSAEASTNKRRRSRMTARKQTNDSRQNFMELEAILSGEENQISDYDDDDDKDADFVPENDSEKRKKKKLSDSSLIQITKTPRVVLTKFNLLKRCIHCDYSKDEIQAIKLHSLDQHTRLFLGVWQDSLDIVLYICPNRFCDFYGSSFNDYSDHLEKCNYGSTDDIFEAIATTKKYIKCLREKRIIKPTTLDCMRQMLVKCLDVVVTPNTSSASTEESAIVNNTSIVKTTDTAITDQPSDATVVNMDMKSISADVSKPITNKAASKDVSKPIANNHVSKDNDNEEVVFKCAFCSFKALALPFNVRTHTVKCHPEFPLYAINLKCVEEGRDNRFVLFCVGVDCEAQFLTSNDYFQHIETCDAVKKLTDDTQLLKTNKFVKNTVHRL